MGAISWPSLFCSTGAQNPHKKDCPNKTLSNAPAKAAANDLSDCTRIARSSRGCSNILCSNHLVDLLTLNPDPHPGGHSLHHNSRGPPFFQSCQLLGITTPTRQQIVNECHNDVFCAFKERPMGVWLQWWWVVAKQKFITHTEEVSIL